MFSPSSEQRFPGSSNSPGTEPMNLGSPLSSPSSLNNSLSFLPPYLLRDNVGTSSPSYAQQSGNWTSPVKSGIQTSQMSPILPQRTLYRSPSASAIGTPNITKVGGPPVQGLFDSLASPKSAQGIDFSKVNATLETSGLSLNESVSNSILSPNKTFGHNSSYMSPAQTDPFYTQGDTLKLETQLDESWVTVFGFPPASASFILQQFGQYGKIVKYTLAASGNWMHIKYQSKLQAKKALSKSGRVYGDNIMVGVKPCIDMKVMNDSGKENDSQLTASFNLGNTSIEVLNSSRQSIKNIRPLTQMYKTPIKDNQEVTPKNKAEPKTYNVVSKAMEYVLNWGQT